MINSFEMISRGVCNLTSVRICRGNRQSLPVRNMDQGVASRRFPDPNDKEKSRLEVAFNFYPMRLVKGCCVCVIFFSEP